MNDHDPELSGSKSDFVQVQIQKDQISITSDTDSDFSEFQRVVLEPISETTIPVKEDKSSPIRHTIPNPTDSNPDVPEARKLDDPRDYDLESVSKIEDLNRQNVPSRPDVRRAQLPICRKDLQKRLKSFDRYGTRENIKTRLHRFRFSLQRTYTYRIMIRPIRWYKYNILAVIRSVCLVALVISSVLLFWRTQESQNTISNLQFQIKSLQKQIVEKSIPNQPNSTLPKFNAASLVFGATIDTSKSSSASLNPFTGFDQSSMVLVDRSDPPANKSWCTYEKEPILTVNLAESVRPTAVSYQHSKWYRKVPSDAPKVYDVVACLDLDCKNWEPLVSGCTYTSKGHAEQLCHIPSSFPVGKVQFRFRENQGYSDRTCVSLVRVYSEDVHKPKVRSPQDAEICSGLKHNYHNWKTLYKYFDYKSCSVLYSKGCCQECPECCEKCDVKDVNSGVVFRIFIYTLLLPLWLCLILIFLYLIDCVLFLIVYGSLSAILFVLDKLSKLCR